jgi:hypothetical protein
LLVFTVANPDWFGGDGAVVFANDYILYCIHPTPTFANKVQWQYAAGSQPLNMSGSPVAIGDGQCVVLVCLNGTLSHNVRSPLQMARFSGVRRMAPSFR